MGRQNPRPKPYSMANMMIVVMVALVVVSACNYVQAIAGVYAGRKVDSLEGEVDAMGAANQGGPQEQKAGRIDYKELAKSITQNATQKLLKNVPGQRVAAVATGAATKGNQWIKEKKSSLRRRMDEHRRPESGDEQQEPRRGFLTKGEFGGDIDQTIKPGAGDELRKNHATIAPSMAPPSAASPLGNVILPPKLPPWTQQQPLRSMNMESYAPTETGPASSRLASHGGYGQMQ